jgi:hypothetical protein
VPVYFPVLLKLIVLGGIRGRGKKNGVKLVLSVVIISLDLI